MHLRVQFEKLFGLKVVHSFHLPRQEKLHPQAQVTLEPICGAGDRYINRWLMERGVNETTKIIIHRKANKLNQEIKKIVTLANKQIYK